VVELERVTHFGADRINSPTNGNTTRPVVADSAQTERCQAFQRYTGFENTEITGVPPANSAVCARAPLGQLKEWYKY
jgi:hypothetical protein